MWWCLKIASACGVPHCQSTITRQLLRRASHSHRCEFSNWWIESQHLGYLRWSASRLTISKYSSNLTLLMPESASPRSVNHSLGEHPSIQLIMASQFISNVAPLLHPTESPNSLDYSLGVDLHMHSITAYRCTSKPHWLHPPGSHTDGLNMHLQTGLIMAAKLA